MQRRTARAASTLALALSLAACSGGGQEEADLHACLSVLEREVEGLRGVTASTDG